MRSMCQQFGHNLQQCISSDSSLAGCDKPQQDTSFQLTKEETERKKERAREGERDMTTRRHGRQLPELPGANFDEG